MELTPKQQTTELIKQAKHILVITGREPNNDQLAAAVALQAALTKLGKQVHAVITDSLPKLSSLVNSRMISTNLDGVRDFIISLDMSQVQVDKLKYNVEGNVLDVTITPLAGNFTKQDASFRYGQYKFDLVIVLGVHTLTKLDRLIEQNPTIFDDLHLINIDFHRVNENYGSVNLVDTAASSVSEILVSLIESLGQGLIDADMATALLAGIMASTNRFTAPNTTPKAMTIAAQLMASGAKQQDIVRVLYSASEQSDRRPQADRQTKSESKPKVSLTSEREDELKKKLQAISRQRQLSQSQSTSTQKSGQIQNPATRQVQKQNLTQIYKEETNRSRSQNLTNPNPVIVPNQTTNSSRTVPPLLPSQKNQSVPSAAVSVPVPEAP